MGRDGVQGGNEHSFFTKFAGILFDIFSLLVYGQLVQLFCFSFQFLKKICATWKAIAKRRIEVNKMNSGKKITILVKEPSSSTWLNFEIHFLHSAFRVLSTGMNKSTTVSKIQLTEFKIPLTKFQISLNEFKIPLTELQLPLNEFHIPLNEHQTPLVEFQHPLTEF